MRATKGAPLRRWLERRRARRWLVLGLTTLCAASCATDAAPNDRRAAFDDPQWGSYVEAGGAGTRLRPGITSTGRIRRVVLDGLPAYAMTVRARDRDRYTPTAQRTELGAGGEMRQGQVRWIAEQIWIPRGAPTGDAGYQFYAVTQFKVPGYGGPAVALNFENNRLRVDRASWQRYGSTHQTDLWTSSSAVARNTWIKVLFHVRWSTRRDGFVEVLGDLGDGRGYRRLMPRYTGWTLKDGADGRPGAVQGRIGIYRRAINKTTTIYFAGYNAASMRRVAEARAGF